ncbi:MAG: MotA/TolQ/ExbB proton channel family protein [Planctomycetota bacterium]|nr:MotA/TolQ/ExbB proton channel family protein [Planctomycetota bacterium]
MTTFFKLPCPHCSKSLKVSQDLAGQSRTCPYCKGTVKIPEPAAPEPESVFPNIVVNTGASALGTGIPSAGTAPQATTTQKSPAPAKPKKKSWFSTGSGDSVSSDVSLLASGVIGAVATIVWLVAMIPLRSYQLGQLFLDRGFVPFATTLLMFWSFAIIVLKWLSLKQQKESMLLDVLPTEVAEEITVESLHDFVKHIRSLPVSGSESFLINRVLRGIEHFRVRKSAAETVTMMESQSAIDANNVAGSYTILKVFIWALPILGFIGTVVGVSSAVASLASSLDSAADMTAMKGSLNAVFSGLGTAFDTTLLALIMSMIVKIPTSAMQKSEEDLITAVDEYCNENLLRRLNDGREGGAERGVAGGANVSIFRDAVEAAMGTHHAELEKWLEKLDKIGVKVTTQIAEGWDSTNTRMQKQQQQHAASLQQQQAEQQKQLAAQIEKMAAAATQIQATLATVASQAATMQSSVNGSFSAAQETLQQRFTGLETGLNSLNGVLTKLGEQSVVVQQVAPARRGWFGGSKKAR